MFYHCEKVNLNLSRPSRQILSTHKYETTEIVDSVDHPTQLIILKNHQDRTTPVVTILITFIGMIQ